jgi:hypothetical protein
MPKGLVRHLVLDTEAANALLAAASVNSKRATVMLAIAAANGQRVVPTAVRGESGWDRTDPGAADANRLIRADDVLDRVGADRVARLRAVVPGASVVDAAVTVTAERAGGSGGVVEILTSDVEDLRDLSANVQARVDIVRL